MDGSSPAPVHARSPVDVAAGLAVDPRVGLAPEDAARRLAAVGPNRPPTRAPRPGWLRLLDQFRNLLVIVLLVGAAVAAAVGDVKDAVAIALVLVLNAVLGYVQEGKAQASLAALAGELVLRVTTRRGGEVVEVAAPDLVPGDVVLLEAGDRVPADARVWEAWAAQVDESRLTGESVPVAKAPDVVVAGDAPLAERPTMAFAGTQVTQGRLVAVVTGTGRGTEVGRVAELIVEAGEVTTPLQRQLDGLAKRLAALSVVVVVAYFALGLARGASVSDTLVSSVALAVAAVPEGLPAVVTLTLAVGTTRMARRGAIVKRLSSVETLGSASVICSDKTGTLTLNEMTAVSIELADAHVEVGGVGYDPEPRIGAVADPPALARLARAAVLCNDSHVAGGTVIGDPTEGALVVLAAKAGVQAAAERDRWPRVAEVPFDSRRKVMVTVHRSPGGGVAVGGSPGGGVAVGGSPGGGDGLVAVKGAWEVVVPRCATVAVGEGAAELGEVLVADLADRAAALAARGLRVLALAERAISASGALATIEAADGEEEAIADLADGLTLLGLVGLLDPPRPEVGEAIARCHRAGVAVKVITGDHVDTARAIAHQLGVPGEAVAGSALDAWGDAELAERIEGIGVIARVAPEHKVRVVGALRADGEVVAMTGDGVNDAPALAAADIGLAMGITGTEVAKESADLVLTDDDFTTIGQAVAEGRSIYDNIVKFVRFQVATSIGALSTFVGAQLLGLPTPFNPLQVLWVNLIMDGPPALALGLDPATEDAMERPPRPAGEQVLAGRRFARVVATGVFMAVGTLVVLAVARDAQGEAQALTLAFTTFVLFQVANAFVARDERRTLARRATFTNGYLWLALGAIVGLQVLVVYVGPLQDLFGTTALDLADWVVAVGVAATLVVFDEARKAAGRWWVSRGRSGRSAGRPAPR